MTIEVIQLHLGEVLPAWFRFALVGRCGRDRCHTMDRVHDLEGAIRIFVLQRVEDEVHESWIRVIKNSAVKKRWR